MNTSSILLVLVAAASTASAQTLSSASLSNGDVTIYRESSPGILTIDPSAPLLTVLQGTTNAAGGNIELFTSSDGLAPLPFASASPTVLTAGFSNGQSVTVSGLNGQDWFLDSSNVYNTAYGADNLANTWFGDFLAAMINQGNAFASGLINGNEALLYGSFLANNGFAQSSDPNVSFIEVDSSIVNVGLGGFLDATPAVASLLNVSEAQLAFAFPGGIQLSEVAKVNGEVVYSFEGEDSGVVLDDGVDSYSATYLVTVPEPSSSVLLLVTGIGFLARRKR